VDATDPDDVVAFGRENGDAGYVVLLNFGSGTAMVEIDETVDATDLVSGVSRAAEGGLTVEDVAVFETPG